MISFYWFLVDSEQPRNLQIWIWTERILRLAWLPLHFTGRRIRTEVINLLFNHFIYKLFLLEISFEFIKFWIYFRWKIFLFSILRFPRTSTARKKRPRLAARASAAAAVTLWVTAPTTATLLGLATSLERIRPQGYPHLRVVRLSMSSGSRPFHHPHVQTTEIVWFCLHMRGLHHTDFRLKWGKDWMKDIITTSDILLPWAQGSQAHHGFRCPRSLLYRGFPGVHPPDQGLCHDFLKGQTWPSPMSSRSGLGLLVEHDQEETMRTI